MWELFQKGGPVMYPLLVCSITGLYILIQKILFLKLNDITPEQASETIKDQLLTYGKDETMRVLRSKRKAPLRMVANAIKLSSLPVEEWESAMGQSASFEIQKMEKNMSILSALITICPMLGLLGTMIGFIGIFHVIGGGGIGNTAALSIGISEKLITTATVLSLTIPFIISFHYLYYKIDVLISKAEFLTNDIAQFCKENVAKLS